MSSENTPAPLAQPEDISQDKLNQSAQSRLEPKQSIESLLAESKRLIKGGYYKKAFNLVESFKGEEHSIPPIANIKLCRRMIICLTRICSRYLTKGDLHRVDHFLKLMNKSYDYLQTWHDLLCTYVSKTNPKFSHLKKILTEPSELYEEGLGDMARVKLKMSPNNHGNTSYLSTADSRDSKPPSFLNKMKRNTIISKESGPVYLEDLSNLEQDSHFAAETLSGEEINATYHLDEFIKYYLITLLNWANFHKNSSKRYNSAYRFLLFANKIAKIIDSCLDPDTLQLIAKIRLALGVFYNEFGRSKEALETFETALNTLQIELSLRISRSTEKGNSFAQIQKLKETVRHLILVSINMSVIYEQRDNYARTLESLRLGIWLAGRFLSPDDDILHMINTQYNISIQRYDKYLKELGELERVVDNKAVTITVEDTKETKQSDHVAKMNYHLYNKFNYDKLNASQFIVIASPSAGDKDANHRNNKSEFFSEEKTEFGESKNWSRLRDIKSEASFARAGTMDDIDMPHTNPSMVWKRPNTAVATKTALRDKKKDKFKLDSTDDGSRFLISPKYKLDGVFDHDKEEFQLDSEEEREHIEKLNRNIKEKKKVTPKKPGVTNKLDYLDIDGFFNKVVDKRIQDKEEELKLHQPKEFRRIVKDYGYFLKSENFDGVEFGFASRSLHAKSRENLGDYTVETKYKPPTFKVAQRNEVKLEAQLVEARFTTESRINQRNLSIKNFLQTAKSPQAKSVKFANSPSGRETKIATMVTIDEQQPSTSRSAKQGFTGKASFSGILMKHHENLGLTTVHNVIREEKKKTTKLLLQKKQKAEMAKLGLITGSPMHHHYETPKGSLSAKHRERHNREINKTEMSQFSETTKNTIQLLMESIEKNIEDDEDIKRRIEENKPLVQTQKPTEKFLKVPEDLAKSTVNMSIKAQAPKKMWNFSQLVKNSHILGKKTVRIQAP